MNRRLVSCYCLFTVLLSVILPRSLSVIAFSIPDPPSSSSGSIFGIPNAGWTKPDWNWGSPIGLGHDCAMACRSSMSSKAQRNDLVESLLCDTDTSNNSNSKSDLLSFEEIKLILALAFQKTRREQGVEAIGQVMDDMARLRYDTGDEEADSRLLVQDIQKRYMWLEPEVEDKIAMNLLWYDIEDYDVVRRRCAGLVLKSIGFVDDGL